MNKSIIVFYSYSGNTREIARLIQRKTEADLFEVEPASSYPTSYDVVVEQAKEEIKAGFKPVLKKTPKGIEAYDVIYAGTPIWCHTMAPPMATFLAGVEWSGKTVIPFCTHGGGGEGQLEADIAKFCRGAIRKPALVVSGNGGNRVTERVTEWLRIVDVQ